MLKRIMTTMLLSSWGIVGLQSAEAKPKTDPIEKLVLSMDNYQADISAIEANYTQRRGLIGKTQAETKFDKAVLRYLMGDYKQAAPEFFILLETGSLDGYDIRREAEWYLVDSAFQLGQYSIVEEACYQIIEQGPSHLFFTDAVRLLLESYGIRNRQDKFQEAMNRFVLSGLVESSDSLNYSIGKALFWQTENARAKAALLEIEPDSSLYQKAQYFFGGILVSEGDYDAGVQAFQQAVLPEPKTASERELNDLANMALGRTFYEIQDFTSAIEYYQNVGAESKYFLDRLYEMAWSFIGMERWEDATAVIEIFLVAYPEDEHAIQFQNTLGDLYMKTQQYEKALVTYENVSEQLLPVQEQLDAVMQQDNIVKELLNARITGENVNYDLPEYAHDMLLKNQTLEQASKLVELSREQKKDVQKAADYADEIEAVLKNKGSGLHVFAKDRHQLKQIEISIVNAALRSLDEEMNILLMVASGDDREKLEAASQELQKLKEMFYDNFQLNQSMEEVTRQYEMMIEEVQSEATSIAEANEKILDDVLSFSAKNTTKIQQLSAEDQAFSQQLLDELIQQLQSNTEQLAAIRSEKTKTLLLASLNSTSDQNVVKAQLIELQKLHNSLLPFWAKTSGYSSSKQKIEKIWSDARSLEDQIFSVYQMIDGLEKGQKKIIAQVLEEQQKDLRSFSDEVIALNVRSEDAGLQAAQKSFENLSQHVEDRMLGADIGIVKVYWIRKTDIEEEISRLKLEQASKTRELQTRFDLISSKLSSD